MSSEEGHSEKAESERPLRGAKVGRYRLAYEVAAGGMATVYIASVEGPAGVDQVVALKRIHSHLAKEKSYVEMFLDEARLASRIRHPNVCTMTDFGEEEGEYFIAMEYLHGVPLSRLIKALGRRAPEKPVPVRWPAMVSKLLAEACEGLHAAHELRGVDGELMGVVHRDVSPQNLFVGFDGILRVVDFGIAKAADKLHQTATAEFKGKVAYMAPEQLKKGHVDRRTDVWALGVVLWEAISLRRLFRKDQEAQTMYAVLEGDILAVSDLAPGVPVSIDDVLFHALDRDIAARTPDARTLGREVSRVWGQFLDESVDSAEVGALMVELFPGERERQASLVELARLSKDEVPIVGTHVDLNSEFSGLSAMAGKTAFETPATKVLPPSRNVWKYLTIVLTSIFVGLLVGGVLISSLTEDDDDETDDRALASTSPHQRRDASHQLPALEPLPAAAEIPESEGDAQPSSAGSADAAPAEGTAAVDTSEESRPAKNKLPGRPPRGTIATNWRRSPATSAPTKVSSPTSPDPAAAPEKAPAETPSKVAATGQVIVVVPGGWANVYNSRGSLIGVTPLRRTLPVGRHVLSLRYFGQPPPEQVVVNVEPAETARVSRRAPER